MNQVFISFVVLALATAAIGDDNVKKDLDDKRKDNTCLLVDYEKDVSAIFLSKTGPIQHAWNVFSNMAGAPYGYMTVKNVDKMGPLKILSAAVVDCGAYGYGDDGFITGPRALPKKPPTKCTCPDLGPGCAASLCNG